MKYSLLKLPVLYNDFLRLFPRLCDAIRPFLPPLSVLVTALCVGAPLAINIESVLSPFGLTILLLIVAFHSSAFIAGYIFTGVVFQKSPDVKALQRTLSYETGLFIILNVIILIHFYHRTFHATLFFSHNHLFQECRAVFWLLHLQIDSSKIHLLVCLQQYL